MEILAPKAGEELHLTPKGTFTLVDKIRHLIQEGKIIHDMSLDLEKLAELTSWEKEDIRNAMPNILQPIFPKGIELKVSRVVAGCSRAEPYIEEWLERVAQGLRREGFCSPNSFQCEHNLFFELVKHGNVGADCEAVIRVKAFLDGRVVAEAEPKHFTDLASRILDATLDKYDIPYETEIPVETPRSPIAPLMLGLAMLGLFGLSNVESP